MESPQLGPEDLLDDVRAELARQSYAPRPRIAGVSLLDAAVSRGPDGLFSELARIDADGQVEGFPGVHPVQWNWSLLEPGAVKAWHLHFAQEDLWVVPPVTTVLVGLADLRRESPTASRLERLVLGAGRCDRLLIPRGVAHGVANLSARPQALLYAVTRHFTPDPARTDEWRLPWDRFGAAFWAMDRG
jgi:dTDP-4-dehydrorhamnose 3,5-epimerase-like enzyme